MGLEEFAGSLLQALVVDGVVDLRTAWGLKSEASAKNAFQTQKNLRHDSTYLVKNFKVSWRLAGSNCSNCPWVNKDDLSICIMAVVDNSKLWLLTLFSWVTATKDVSFQWFWIKQIDTTQFVFFFLCFHLIDK